MADKKITQLTNITGADLVDVDEFVVVDISADETKAITLGELKEAFDSGSGFVRITGDTMTGDLTVPNVIVSGNVDGRDVSADGTKLDGIEAGADVTDTANVTAAGALMESEVTNLAQVKAFDSSDYATAAQGVKADASVQTTAATGQANMPAGTTAQRTGSPIAGALRFNSTDVSFEGYDGTEWGAIGGGGGASEGIFYENDQSLSTNYTIVSTKNAMTAGPITINDGVTVTIETGGRWVVL